MKRVYHPYIKWEEYPAGLWVKHPLDKERKMLQPCIEFTSDTERYGDAMIRVIKEWPFSCEHNLSCRGMNRQAWIGHAAACIEMGFPEHVTRLAWSYLTPEQQEKANTKADAAIAQWEEKWQKQA